MNDTLTLAVGSANGQDNKWCKKSNGARKRLRMGSLLSGHNLGVLSDSSWWILPFHKFNIPRIAELAWKFRHSAAGYTDKIEILQFGFADVSRVR